MREVDGLEPVRKLRLVDDRDRLPIGPVSILAHDGRVLGHEDLWMVRREDLGKRPDGSIATPGKPTGKGDVVNLEAAKTVVEPTSSKTQHFPFPQAVFAEVILEKESPPII